MSGKRRPNRRVALPADRSHHRESHHPETHHPERLDPPDRGDWRAEHPDPPAPASWPPGLSDLAPNASTGDLNQYSPMGQVARETNLGRGLLRNRHWYNRAFGWLLLLGVLTIPALGLWRLITLFT